LKLFTKDFLLKNRFTIISLVVIVLMFLIVQLYHGNQNDASTVKTGTVQTTQNSVKIGGPFEMVNQSGQKFTEQDLMGKYSLIFFGFTYCPDVCPTKLAFLADVYDSLTPVQQKRLNMVFVSVDPERDTPRALDTYLENFHPDIVGLTGSPEQLKAMADEYLVYYAKRENESDPTGYLMDHSAYTYFMDPSGKYITHFKFKDNKDQVLDTINSYLNK